MGKPRLADYVQKQVDAGYDINKVRKYLVGSGYDSREVNEAVDYIYKKKPSGKKLPIAIIGVIGIVLVVVLGFVLFSGKEEIPGKLLDLETSGLSNVADAGDNLEFNVELTNMGNKKRYDVELTHELIDLRGQTIATKQETVAIETQTSKKSQIGIPEDATGSYTIKTTASYDGESARSYFTVNVKGEEEPEVTPVVPVPDLECPTSCDDGDICTQDSCGSNTGYQCFSKVITPCCGNNICEPTEGTSNCPNDCKEGFIDIYAGIETVRSVVEEAKEIAASNPDQASDFCAGQERDNFRSNCYKAVAETARQSVYCEPIDSDVTRDSCYTTAALTWDDFTVCDKVTDRYLKIACEGYAQAEAATS